MGEASKRRVLLTLGLVIFGVHAIVSLVCRDSYKLTVFADVVQTVVMASLALLALRNTLRSAGHLRAFWVLMTLGFCAWTSSQVMWAWFEIVLRRPVPEPFSGDIVLFLHVVPFMAALVMRPHRSGGIQKLYLVTMDFVLLLLWWLFLFIFLVIPWQIYYDRSQYSVNFNLLYLAENIVWIASLALLWNRAEGRWRGIYAGLLGGGAIYLLSSQFINSAILADRYYTGSAYDLPLLAGMLCFAGVLYSANNTQDEPGATSQEPSEVDAYVSRVAMLASLSLPVMGALAAFQTSVPQHIRYFRLGASLAAMLLISVVLFAKQYLLDRERIRLLEASRESYRNLKRLQAQLVQSEKLAALGQIVSGAAHEINNPLTAILGYAELIEADAAEDGIRNQATKIKQQARRTKDLVLNLQRFARASDSSRKLVDVNRTILDSLHLRELELEERSLRVQCDLGSNIPPVWADQTQIMDVFFQLIGNALDAVDGQKDGKVQVRTRRDGESMVVEVLDSGPGISNPARVFDPFYTTKGLGKGPGLGLSACYGIVKEHSGQISCENRTDGGALFTVRLPLATSIVAARSSGVTEVPVGHGKTADV